MQMKLPNRVRGVESCVWPWSQSFDVLLRLLPVGCLQQWLSDWQRQMQHITYAVQGERGTAHCKERLDRLQTGQIAVAVTTQTNHPVVKT